MIQGIIFDMDGVLVDNDQQHFKAFEIFCRRYGVADWRDKLAALFGMGNRDIMSQLLPPAVIAEKGFDALADEKEAIYREIYAPTIAPGAGLHELLEGLARRGVRCAVGSSGCVANVEFVLGSCGIGKYFDVRVTGDAVTRCKPDPEIYLPAAERLGLAPDRGLVFEVARAGIEAARRAGVRTVVALATTLTREELARTEADVIIDDFRDLDDARLDALLNA